MTQRQTTLEAALRHDRFPLAIVVIVAPLVSWLWIVVLARDMYGPMTGASAWMMTATWDVPHLLLLWTMWGVMMAAMMLPSASPTLLLYGLVARRQASGQPAARNIYTLAAGYVAVWFLFSAAVTGLQRVLAAQLIVSPMMETTDPKAAAVLLLVAGLYQLTPLKRACLRTCQSPLGFLMRRWRPGTAGALRMGAQHGAYCIGCCWALMLLLFVGGVMNLAVIAALTALVAFEKLAPFGRQSARVSGALLITAAAWMLVR
jgi:predicted metal-binding membrane protein